MIRRLPQPICWCLAACFVMSGCSVDTSTLQPTGSTPTDGSTAQSLGTLDMSDDQSLEIATFAAGCYWCTEAVFQRLKGVDNVVSGFMGGVVENPSYEAVCMGTTGHAEVIQLRYDPQVITYQELLEVFWKTHDPTTLNRQGADEGTQYRSAVFYHTEAQRQLAETYKQKLDEAKIFEAPIVTEITAASVFYSAKADHQDFYNANPFNGYCGQVIRPKLDKFESIFSDKLKRQ